MEHRGEIDLLLRCRQINEKQVTYVEKNYYKLPLQVMLPDYEEEDGTKIIFLLNPTGGILQRDELHISIKMEQETKACITAPSATKLYKCERGENATQEIKIIVGQNAVLEYFPDLMIPFPDSSFLQKTQIYLKKNSTMIACDFFCTGRISLEESFAFHKLNMEMMIYIDDKLTLLDQTKLEPGKKDYKNQVLMGDYTYAASFYIYSNKVSELLIEQLKKKKEKYNLVEMGYSLVERDILIVRILGNTNWMMKEIIDEIWGVLRNELLGKKMLKLRK